MKYLDLEGLLIYSGKVKELLNDKADNDIVTEICNELSRITTLTVNKKETQYFLVGAGFDSRDTEIYYKLNGTNYTKVLPGNDSIPSKVEIDTDITTLSFYVSLPNYWIWSIDITNLDMSKVTDMSNMFHYCGAIRSINVSTLDTSNVTTMEDMFSHCETLSSLDLSNFDTSNVTNMAYMFWNCVNLTSLDLSNFDTSNVTNMTCMFCHSFNLTSLDLSNFDTSNVTNMSLIFYECDKLNYIKCKQVFKDWCIVNQDTIKLPNNMRAGGSGTWDIVD